MLLGDDHGDIQRNSVINQQSYMCIIDEFYLNIYWYEWDYIVIS